MFSWLKKTKASPEKKEDLHSLDHPLIAFMAQLSAHLRTKFHIDYLTSVAGKLLQDASPIPDLNEKNVNTIIDSLSLREGTKAEIKKEAKVLLPLFLKRFQEQKSKPSAREEVANLITDFLSKSQVDKLLEEKDFSHESVVLKTNKDKQNILHFLAQNGFKSISARGLSTLLGNLDPVTLGELFRAVDSTGSHPLDFGYPSDKAKKDIILYYQQKLPPISDDLIKLSITSSFSKEPEKPKVGLDTSKKIGRHHS